MNKQPNTTNDARGEKRKAEENGLQGSAAGVTAPAAGDFSQLLDQLQSQLQQLQQHRGQLPPHSMQAQIPARIQAVQQQQQAQSQLQNIGGGGTFGQGNQQATISHPLLASLGLAASSGGNTASAPVGGNIDSAVLRLLQPQVQQPAQPQAQPQQLHLLFSQLQQPAQVAQQSVASLLSGIGLPPNNPTTAPAQNTQVGDLLRILLAQQQASQVPAPVVQRPATSEAFLELLRHAMRPDPPAEACAPAAPVAAATAVLPLLQNVLSSSAPAATATVVPSAVAAAPSAPTPAAAAEPAPVKRRKHNPSHTVDNSNVRSVPLYMPSDDESVSPFQAYARQQIELFEAQGIDAQTGAQGRNKAVTVGQVGIRCMHCKNLHPKLRSRSAVYYPSRLNVLYQAAQNIVNVHLPQLCESVPDDVRAKLLSMDNKRSSVGGGKNYWRDTASVQGVVDSETGLRFRDGNKKDDNHGKNGGGGSGSGSAIPGL